MENELTHPSIGAVGRRPPANRPAARSPLAATGLALAVAGAALGLKVLMPGRLEVAFAIVAAYALLGRAQAIQALGISWLLMMTAAGMQQDAGSAPAMGRYLVLGAAATSVGARTLLSSRRLRVSVPALVTALLGVFLVVHSLLFSVDPLVSTLKAVSWATAATTLVAAWGGMPPEQRDLLERQVFGGCVLVLIASLPLIGTAQGYLRNGTGFQGVFGQPQAFGAAMAILGAWVVGELLGTRAPPWRRITLAAAITIAVGLSESRTAGAALIGGALLGALFARTGARGVHERLPGLRCTRLRVALSALVVVAVVGASRFAPHVTQFVQKRTDASSFIEAYEISRGAKIRDMWANFLEHPFHGIGFGIASDPSSMIVERDATFGLPTGAAVEKGVLPIALLEEVGLPGTALVLVWLAILLRRARAGGVTTTTVLCTALLTNLGEASLFSPGGFGLLPLIATSWAGTAKRESDVARVDHP